jgi:RNA polymerase sigma-70 factor (ECF subfamily)
MTFVLVSVDAVAWRLSVYWCEEGLSAPMTAISRRSTNQKERDADVFAEFVREHEPVISRHIARVYNDQEVASVVAGVFAIAWKRYPDIPQDRAQQWLKGVARHVVFNTRRSDARWKSLQRAARETVLFEAAPVDDDRRLQAKIVAAALQTLSRDDQSILRIQGAEEPSSTELASILGISVRATRTRLSRARRRLHLACEQLLATEEVAR